MAQLQIYLAEEQIKSKSHKKDYVEWITHIFHSMSEPLPLIKDGRGTRIARGGKNFLNLPRWSRTEITMLHEISHLLQYRHLGYSRHDKNFKSLMLGLVGWFISEEKMNELEKAYNTKWID